MRWHWCHAKRKFCRLLNKRGYLTIEEKPVYFGVTDEWIMSVLVRYIESWNIGKVFVFERDAVVGDFIGDVIIEIIDRSRTLLYVVGKDAEAGEMKSFRTSLQLASIARLNDIIVIYRDLITFESLQQKKPHLKSLCRPGRRHPIRIFQIEANGVYCWTELHHYMTNVETANEEEMNEACVCTCRYKKCC